jgi:VWFA-related protein
MATSRRALFLLLFFAFAPFGWSQQPQEENPAASQGKILLNVFVTAKSGQPVAGLQQQEFTVLDNKAPQTLTFFSAVDGRQAPIEVIVVIDAVNIGYDNVARQRQEVARFLRLDGGRLAFPTTLAVSTDKGIQIQPDFSKDGNAISASLEQSDIGLRDIRRSAGFYGAEDRLDISLRSFQELATKEAAKPGRKIILWVSPGWPILSGPGVQESLGEKQRRQIFAQIQELSTLVHQGQITLYSIDPLGTADIGMRTFYWQSFLKPVTKPSQALPGNLSLQVLAAQSGGLVLNSSNDIAAQLQKCIAENGSYYQMAYDQPRADQPRQYHQIEIHLATKGLTGHTIQGYYALP